MASGNALNNRLNSLNINGAYSLPTSDGGSGAVLTTNGQGTCSWTQGGTIAQTIVASSTSIINVNASIPIDNTIPQITEGVSVLTLNITPKASGNLLIITYNWCGSTSGGNLNYVTALFFNAASNAFYATVDGNSRGGTGDCRQAGSIAFTAGTTSASTIQMRVGVDANNMYINGSSAGGGIFGGVSEVQLLVQEIRV